MDMHNSTKVDQVKWDDLRFFLEVARTRTATGAARRLGVDYTTVSRRVRALEQALGALLFEKSRSAGFVLRSGLIVSHVSPRSRERCRNCDPA